MEILDVHWTHRVNIATVCCCTVFEHPLNRWKVICPKCGRVGNINELRNNYIDELSKRYAEKKETQGTGR